MTQKNPLFTQILQNYQKYIQFQQKLLLNPSKISESEFSSVKNDFCQFYQKIDTPLKWKQLDVRLKQFYLKYLTQYITMNNFSYKLFKDYLLGKASIIQKISLFLKNFQNLFTLTKQIRKLGYNSYFDAYLKIFQVEEDDFNLKLHMFLDSSEKEYRLLFTNQIQHLDETPKKLGNRLKNKLYQGKWLCNEYLSIPYSKIIKRTQVFLQKHGFLSPKMMQRINIIKGKNASLLGGYESITFPVVGPKNLEISTLNVFLKETLDIVPSNRNIVHELGHCVQILNFNRGGLFEKLIPYESAVSELGGTLIDSLMCFPEYIADIFDISDFSQSRLIAQYNRFMDLFYKRFYALTVLNYAKIFHSNQISLRHILKVKKIFKKQSLEKLEIKNVNFHLFRLDLVHYIDFIRGHLLIQERFVQTCQYDLELFLGHREALLTFFSHGLSQSYKKALIYFENEIFHTTTVKKDLKRKSLRVSFKA